MDARELNFEEIMQRVAMIIETDEGRVPFDKHIAFVLGLSPTQYANMKKRNKIPFYELSIFGEEHQITINWILYGKSSRDLIDREENVYMIRLIDRINASCGGGGVHSDNTKENYIYIEQISAKHSEILRNKHVEALKSIGDSMEPTIAEDAIVLVDRSQNKLKANHIYVVNTTDGLFVKRLKLKGDEEVELISDNPKYATMCMGIEDVTIIGEVLGVLEKYKNDEKRECNKVYSGDGIEPITEYFRDKGVVLKKAVDLL